MAGVINSGQNGLYVEWLVARELAERTLARLREKFDPNQPRDEDGKWTDSGGGGGGGKPPPQGELFPGKFPPIPEPGKPVKDDDFKDKVKLSSRLSDEKKQRLFQEWNTRVKEPPEEFRREFMGGLDGTMTIGLGPEDEWVIEGKITDAAGNTIGTYSREINFERGQAESAYFKLNADQTGKDVGKKMLAANVAKYQELGLTEVRVHANIDVGGYAWAKYGYVPDEGSWRDLSSELSDKLGGGGGYKPESWDEISSDQQDAIYRAWRDSTYDEFYDSEVESWRDSDQPLEDMKKKLAEDFDKGDAWAVAAVQAWRESRPADRPPLTLSNDEILNATDVSYEPARSSTRVGQNDPDIYVKENITPTLTDDDRAEISDKLVDAFNAKAEADAPDMDPPDYVAEGVADRQSEYWDSMRDRDKYRWADDNGYVEETESDSDIENADELRDLIDSSDPKAIWAIADTPGGKELLLGTDWNGTIDLTDKETMARFNAYIGKAKQSERAVPSQSAA